MITFSSSGRSLRPLARRVLLLPILAAAALGACSENETVQPPATTSADTSSFGRFHAKIVATSCAVSGCHVAGLGVGSNGGLVLDSAVAYQNLVGVEPTNANARADKLLRVKPGSADSSLLFHKLHAPGGHHTADYGSQMPLGGRPLSVGQIEFVRQWIESGAPRTGVVADARLLDDTTSSVTGAFTPLPPPAPGTGVQLHLPMFPVQPNFEREFFSYTPVGNAQELYVTGLRVRMRPGSHHFLMYDFPPGTPGSVIPPPNVIRDIRNPDGSDNPDAMEAMAYHRFVGGSTGTDFEYSFPPGVAMRIPPNAMVDLNSHYVNKTPDTLYGEVYANMMTIPASAVQHVAEPMFLNNDQFSLPPQQQTVVTKTFKMGGRTNVCLLTSHTHQLGAKYVIRISGGPRNGEIVYTSTDWAHPAVTVYNPPIVLEAGQGLTSEVTFQNTTNRTVRFGLTSEDEMDIIFGYSYE